MFETNPSQKYFYFFFIDSPGNRTLYWIKNFFLPESKNKTLILLYHRVVEDLFQSSIERLYVTKSKFMQQMKYLSDNFDVLSLTDYINNPIQKKKKQVIVTFDDGFRDNYLYAFPILKANAIPATIFITSNLLKGEGFWFNIFEMLIYDENRNIADFLGLGNYSLTDIYQRRKICQVVAGKYKKLNHEKAVKLVASLIDKHKEAYLEYIKNLFLTPTDIKKMTEQGIITIGAHTQSHSIVSLLKDDEAFLEICGSKNDLEKILDLKITTFAFPNGVRKDFLCRDIDLVKKSGFLCACTSLYGTNTLNSDPFLLKRVQVSNWSLDKFKYQIDRAFRLS